MTKCSAYGLAIESEIDLPGLPTTDAPTQVTVRLAPVEKPPGEGDAERIYAAESGQFRVYWRGVGTFLIRQGREIFVEPEAGVEADVVRLYVQGPALGILIHQRGFLVLHASAVSINGSVVGFMGEKGWGKSTTAAALNARGHPLVTDDILPVILQTPDTPLVQPGPAHFKLWPEAVMASFGDDPNTLIRLHSQVEKRVREAKTGLLQNLMPLRRLYVLDRGTQLECRPMPPAAALMAFVRHSYLSRLMQAIGESQSNFLQCAQLAERVSVSYLHRPRDLSALGRIVELVEAEAEADGAMASRIAAACR